MSVPDNSRPKAPPSLLADGPGKAASAPANAGAPNGSRILANLEGRVVPPAAPAGKTPRASKTAALVALLVIGAGGFGAWHLMTRAPSAASGASTPASATVAAAASASQAVVARAQTGAPDEASASHAATIVADDEAANAKPSADNGASAPANDADRLSRALADGAHDGNASGAAVAAAAPKVQSTQSAQAAQSAKAHERTAAKRQAANERHAQSKTAVAQAKKPHNGAKKDDSDVDLLAVLVARTKPADARTAAHGAKSAGKAQGDGNAPLAQQVKACGDRGFFEDQLCRWRVCDGHWGTDPACPSAARASNEH